MKTDTEHLLEVAQISFLLDRYVATNSPETKNIFTFDFDENIPISCEPNVNFLFFSFSVSL